MYQTIDKALGRLQFWLQGAPNRRRPWFVVRCGNILSDFRFVLWERRVGQGYREGADEALAISESTLVAQFEALTASTNIDRE